MRSDVIQMKMQPGGREIASMETQAPSELEFLPNLPAQRHRKFIGDRMWIVYAAQNRIQSFTSVNCRTVSDPTAEETGQESSGHDNGEQECFGDIRSENQPVGAHGTVGRFLL